ncbi:MAG TPA: EAL domain-containing protein, partial [Chloroflexota bacterium]|nr:EAL domain-containing protein [Chloroflexota bacterium]
MSSSPLSRNSPSRRAAEEHAHLAAILSSSAEPIIATTPDGLVTTWNYGAERLYGYSAAEMLGESILRLVPECATDTFQSLLRRVNEGDERQVVEFEQTTKDGRQLQIAFTVSPIPDADGRVTGVSLVGHDITERKRAEAVLHRQAWRDALTNLPNRTRLRVELERLAELAETDATEFALLFIDLDRFKDVNDALGHQRGDLLLRQIGPRLGAELAPAAMLARLGADEFAVLLPGCGAGEAAAVAERLLAALERPFDIDGTPVGIGASIGIALYPASGRDEDTLLRHADVALYAAKGTGRGYTIYSTDQDRHSPERLALVADLRQAIEHGELVLHYQPQLDVRSGELVGFEALARWPHPQRGLVSPAEFIPLAEQTRLIRPLTRWAIRAALEQSAAWHGTSLALPVAVNLTAHDLQDPTLPEFVDQALTRSGVASDRLRLEITESSLMADPRGARESLQKLRTLGVLIAIDDFGTGYSSLEYLRNLPVDALKIDRSF